MRSLLVAAAFAACAVAPAFALDRSEKAMIAAVDKEAARGEQLLEKLVNVNSGTLNLPGVEKVGQMMRTELEELGFTVRWVPMGEVQRAGHIVAEHPGPKGGKNEDAADRAPRHGVRAVEPVPERTRCCRRASPRGRASTT